MNMRLRNIETDFLFTLFQVLNTRTDEPFKRPIVYLLSPLPCSTKPGFRWLLIWWPLRADAETKAESGQLV